jgi:hypothetical protein
VDPRTGEVHELAKPVRYAFLGPHAQVDKTRVQQITESTFFTPSEKYLVLWWIGASPEGMEPLQLTGTDIAQQVGMKADSVRRINRKLAHHRILVRAGRIGNYPLYRITPYIAFHGTGAEQREAVKDFNPPDIPMTKEQKTTWEAE